MKLEQFLSHVPQSFVLECLEALPGVDRRRLLQAHNCRVKMGPATLKRRDRMVAEAKKLYKAITESDDPEDKRSLFQGWLARRGEMIIAFLDAWEIEHKGGFVEDFDWVEKLELDKVKASIEQVKKDKPEVADDRAIAIYLAYLELPHLEELYPVASIFAEAEAPESTG